MAIIGAMTGRTLAAPKSTRPLDQVFGELAQQRADRGGKAWHLVTTMHGSTKACGFLKRGGFEYYAPQYRIMKKVPRKRMSHAARRSGLDIREPVFRPLLDGYCFVMIDLASENWHQLFDLAGLRGLACADGTTRDRRWLPVPVSQAVIDNLRRREIGGAIPAETKIAALIFEIGELVRINSGPFIGFPARVVEIEADITIDEMGGVDESVKMKLLVAILGREVLVNIPVNAVERG